MIWRCPLCHSSFNEIQSGLMCEQGHQFDCARQGYYYLVMANQRKSKEPGDNLAMVDARRQFLRDGHYTPVLEKIAELCSALTEHHTVLDLGCGEGWYLEALAAELKASSNISMYGVDIAKVAIRKAAASAKAYMLENDGVKIQYAVASSVHVPVIDHCADVVLSVFAPSHGAEVCRLLKPNGSFIRVSPGPRHLYQLKQAIYKDIRLHTTPAVDPVFKLESEHRVQFTLQLGSKAAINSLLAMTPFGWHGSSSAKNVFTELDHFEVEADFLLQVCKPAKERSVTIKT